MLRFVIYVNTDVNFRSFLPLHLMTFTVSYCVKILYFTFYSQFSFQAELDAVEQQLHFVEAHLSDSRNDEASAVMTTI